MKKYKIIFCGTPEISADILKTLLKLNVEIVGVISQPDKPVGRKQIIEQTPVKKICLANNLKIIQPNKIKDDFEIIKNMKADFLITCAYGQIIPKTILELFKNCLNVHASLLPKYRGGSPIQFAILNGDKKTGISIMQMVVKMDAGAVYKQEEVMIQKEDDSESLTIKLSKLASKILEKDLLSIFEDKIQKIKQDEEKVTYAYNLKGLGEKINWNLSSIEIVNFIRALSPKPIAYTMLNNERWKIKKARVVNDDEQYISLMKIFRPGEIINTDKEGIFVQTSNGVLKILEIQRPGKKMTNAAVFNDPNSPLRACILFE